MLLYRTFLILCATIGLVVTISCNNEDDGENNNGNPIDPITQNNTGAAMCDKLTAEEVNSTLGVSGFAATEATVNSSVTECKYENVDFDYVTIIFYPNVSRNTFDQTRKYTDDAYSSWDTDDAPGIGDAAYAYSVPFVILGVSKYTHTVTMLKGTTQVMITTTSDATLDKVKSLAILIAGKI